MGRLRNGTCRDLEDRATALLRESVTNGAGRGDVLTPGMMEARQRREILVSTGMPDGRVRKGVFSRAWNPSMPHLNSRDGAMKLSRGGTAGAFSEQGPADDGD